MTQHNSLILRPGPNGEIAHLIAIKEADEMVKKGTAVRLPDGVYREVKVVAPKKAPAPAKNGADYATKEMKPAKKG